MPSEWALNQRKIQPHDRPGSAEPRSGTWRKETKAAAKRFGISRRRLIRRIAKAKRAARGN